MHVRKRICKWYKNKQWKEVSFRIKKMRCSIRSLPIIKYLSKVARGVERQLRDSGEGAVGFDRMHSLPIQSKTWESAAKSSVNWQDHLFRRLTKCSQTSMIDMHTPANRSVTFFAVVVAALVCCVLLPLPFASLPPSHTPRPKPPPSPFVSALCLDYFNPMRIFSTSG